MSRLNIDETVPIESGLVGRLVESSQTRVEGSNFDVRKHLLEYDDVLNDQRQRIYSQRDKIFTKPDLREDVTEMLRTELGNRIETALQDTEGPWKLLAYLDEIQPALNFSWLSYPSYSLNLVMKHIGTPQTETELIDKLLAVVKDAITAENDHLLINVHSLLSRTKDSLKEHLDERFDALDVFLEGSQYEDESNTRRDLATELSNILHLPIKLTSSQLKTLAEDPYALKTPLRDTIRAALTQIMVRRLILTFERRLNENWTLNASTLATEPWDQISKTLLEKIEDSLSHRSERLLGESGEIKRDLDANQDHISSALQDQGELMRLFMLMTQGTVITFDAKSHKKQLKPTLRVSYVFLLARWLENKSLQDITGDVLTHLELAEQKFIEVFGNAEWDNHVSNADLIKNLPSGKRDFLKELLGESGFSAIQEQTLQGIDPSHKVKIVIFFGKQTQNSIYRRLLLGTISEAWVEYLTRMESLRISISLESYGQRDPLVQYKGKASTMFTELLSEVRAGVISKMFRYRPTQSVETQPTLRSIPSNSVSSAKTAETKSVTTNTKKKKRKRH
ncbi:MAG: hypothetical protein MUO40_01860 [Anaerolineaceae bacterium]|nr:hypothetical protein [Anaerolineaceae bacterium]